MRTKVSVANLPDFLVIGARKAGTTSLFSYLASHPQVFMPPQKEVHFFSDHNWRRGLDWYRSLFAGAGDAAAVGEASPGYSHYQLFPGVPERIAQMIPDVRLIYILREPVARLVSSYRQDVHSWGERRPIEEALFDVERFLSGSMYALQIERYLEYFDRRQLLVITSEALRDERVDTLRRVYGFLGVDADWTPGGIDRELNRAEDLRRERPLTKAFRSTPVYRLGTRLLPKRIRDVIWRVAGSLPSGIDPATLELPESTRREIIEALKPDLRRVVSYVGGDFDAWGLLDETPTRA